MKQDRYPSRTVFVGLSQPVFLIRNMVPPIFALKTDRELQRMIEQCMKDMKNGET
jgi:hypothetical protein